MGIDPSWLGWFVIENWWVTTEPVLPSIRYEQKQNKGKPAKTEVLVMIFIYKYLFD
jgi:hypothetical protein